MRFIFLTNTRHREAPWQDASTRYRCYHLAEELTKAGHQADVCHIDEFDTNSVAGYDAAILLRPVVSRKSEDVLNQCRQSGVLSVADYDDLIFQPALAEESPAVINRSRSIQATRKLHTDNLALLREFDRVTLATQPLVEIARSLANNVASVPVPNGLSSFWLSQNQHLVKSVRVGRQLRYLPGSGSHDHDFPILESIMDSWLKQDDTHRLTITGKLHADLSRLPKDQVKLADWIDYSRLPALIVDAYSTLAPLQDNTFNRCKSHIKFIESAAFGTPLIASRIPDLDQHQVPGLYCADSPQDWLDALAQLEDPEFYHHCSQSLLRYSRRYCTAMTSANRFIQALSDHPHANKTDSIIAA